MLSVDIKLSLPSFQIALKENFPKGITGIFGASGAGKTSFLQSIAGLQTPVAGFVAVHRQTLFDSENRINIPLEKRKIGFIFQEGLLFPHLNVKKNLTYGMKRKNPHLLEKIMLRLHLERLLPLRPHQLSGGEKQRVAIGRTLLSSPALLLMDEPFSAIDKLHRKEILIYLKELEKQLSIPILIVSHELSDLLQLTNRLCLLQNGRCIGHGFYEELLLLDSCQKVLHASLPV